MNKRNPVRTCTKRRSRRYAKNKLRIQLLMLVIMVLVISYFSFVGFSKKAYASDNVSANRMKCYTSVQIHLGDDLESISSQYITYEYKTYKQYISEVCSINSIPSDVKLIPGNYIIVPYYADKI